MANDGTSKCCSLAELLDPALFKALGHSNRVTLLEELCRCSCARSVSELSECCDVDMSVVSRHLSKLRDAGIVQSRRDKQKVEYSVDVHQLADLLRAMADAIENASRSDISEES